MMNTIQRIEYKLNVVLAVLGVSLRRCTKPGCVKGTISSPQDICDLCCGSGLEAYNDSKMTERKDYSFKVIE